MGPKKIGNIFERMMTIFIIKNKTECMEQKEMMKGREKVNGGRMEVKRKEGRPVEEKKGGEKERKRWREFSHFQRRKNKEGRKEGRKEEEKIGRVG